MSLRIIEPVPYTPGRRPPPPPTLAELQTSNPTLHALYKAEQDRVREAINVVFANIDKQKRIDDAFRALQRAENARDTAPIAYQQARTNYYTLLKGDTWKTTERERIARAEIDPEIQQFRRNLADVQSRQSQQQRTVDVVNGLKDRVLSIKDDFKYSTDTLQRQLGKLRDQIIFDRRKREEQSKDSKWDLLDKGLNYAIVAALVFAIWKIYTTFFSKPSSGATNPTEPPRPAVSAT